MISAGPIHTNKDRTAGWCRFFANPLSYALVVILVGAMCYANTFNAPLVLDDLTQIRDNPVVHTLSGFFQDGKGYDYNPNRFVGYLTFALNYHFGGLHVAGYHVVNVLIHIANALLVYSLVLLTFQTPHLRGSVLLPHAGFAAFVVALLFVCHPVQTQAVTYIYQRLASLATLFYLATLVLHVRWRLSRTKGAAFSGRVIVYWGLSLVTAVLAMKTKEVALTLPVIVLLYEFCFFGIPGRRLLLVLLPLLLTGMIIPLSTINLTKSLGEMLSEVSSATVLQSSLPRWEYLFTQFSVIVTYLRLLFLPIRQNLDYDYPINHTLSDPRAFLSLILLVAILGAAILLWWRSFSRGDAAFRLAAFGILWFFLTLMVESSLIPIADVIFEHRLYLPSVGIFMMVIIAFAIAVERYLPERRRQLAFSVVILIVLGFGSATIARNHVWGDSIRLWQDVVRKSPRKIRPYNNLGASLSDAGRFAEATRVLSEAIQLKPDHCESWYNLGRVYLLTGQSATAVQMFRRAVVLKPDYDDAFINLAAALNRLGAYRESVALLERKLDRIGERADARFNLGVAYAYLGNSEAARRELAQVTRLDPSLAPSLAKLLR